MKKNIFRQNNPNSADYDSNLPTGWGYWEESGEEVEEPIPDENDELENWEYIKADNDSEMEEG